MNTDLILILSVSICVHAKRDGFISKIILSSHLLPKVKAVRQPEKADRGFRAVPLPAEPFMHLLQLKSLARLLPTTPPLPETAAESFQQAQRLKPEAAAEQAVPKVMIENVILRFKVSNENT